MRKVRVYWNLHKGCYSVQDYKTGKVISQGNSKKSKSVRGAPSTRTWLVVYT